MNTKHLHARRLGHAATEGLLGLAACASGRTPTWADEVPDRTAAHVTAVGDTTGEVWLHLLPLALDLRSDADPSDLADRLAAMAPTEVMDLVVGVNVPAWHDCVEVEVLEAAAAGDAEAALRLLVHPQYYGGQAASALTTLLGLGPQVAAARIQQALRTWFDTVVAPCWEHLASLHADLEPLPAGESALAVVEEVTGVRFEPEDYTDEVVVVPQFVATGWRVMAQDGSARIIVYDAAGGGGDVAALARTFAALGEPTRLEILRHLATTPGGVSDVARATGVAKSTAHRHLAVLREAGLLTLAGQAWRYHYEVAPDRVVEAAERLHHLLTRKEEE